MNQLSTTVLGSLADVAAKSNTSIAQAFIDARYIILVDTSASMTADDVPARVASWEERRIQPSASRYEVACQELAKLQASLAGKIAVIAFSSSAIFCPSGVPTFLKAGTDLADALRFIHIADGLVEKFIVISDGEPNNEHAALAEAAKFTTEISTIYIGPPGGPGADFLARLARSKGGQSVTSKQAAQLADSVQKLLSA